MGSVITTGVGEGEGEGGVRWRVSCLHYVKSVVSKFSLLHAQDIQHRVYFDWVNTTVKHCRYARCFANRTL